MGQLFKNNARATLGVDLLYSTVAGATFALASGKGTLFPAPGVGEFFDVTVQDATNIEVIRCSARSGDTLTIQERDRELTTLGGVAHGTHTFLAGSIVSVRLTAGAVVESLAHPAVTTGAHAASAISNVPNGAGISATSVQAALDELDTEKASLVDLSNHVAAADPHPTYTTAAELASALTVKQDADPTLVALAALVLAADKLIYGNGSETAAMIDFDAAARTLLTLKKFSGVATFDSRYDEKVNARGSISGAQTLNNTLGTYITATIGGATTFTFTNPAASGYLSGFLLELTNGSSATITWPASVKWPGGTPPTFTLAGIDILVFTTRDGGTTWRGSLTQKDSK